MKAWEIPGQMDYKSLWLLCAGLLLAGCVTKPEKIITKHYDMRTGDKWCEVHFPRDGQTYHWSTQQEGALCDWLK